VCMHVCVCVWVFVGCASGRPYWLVHVCDEQRTVNGLLLPGMRSVKAFSKIVWCLKGVMHGEWESWECERVRDAILDVKLKLCLYVCMCVAITTPTPLSCCVVYVLCVLVAIWPDYVPGCVSLN